MRQGRTKGVAYTRWYVTAEDRAAIAAYLGERSPVTLRRAHQFLEHAGLAGLEEAWVSVRTIEDTAALAEAEE